MNDRITQEKSVNSLPYERVINTAVGILFIVIVLSIASLMYMTIFMQVTVCSNNADKSVEGLVSLMQIICWVDPVFMIYSQLMLLLLVMIVPVITFTYVHTMKKRKDERLRQQIPQTEDNIKKIECCLDETFTMRYYAGSMTLLSIVILLGGIIILMLKPMPLADIGTQNSFGVDYRKGANFLMLGSYMHYFIEGNMRDYMRVLMATLTAFQFGFLGAYVYFITHLVRSYFTLDLSPNIYISCTIRIIMGSVLSLILSFLLISTESYNHLTENTDEQTSTQLNTVINPASATKPTEKVIDKSRKMDNASVAGLKMSDNYYYLPMLSFFIGFFPLRGLMLLERAAGSVLHILPEKYQSTSLSHLTGMSPQHEMRLNREGFDNVENLVNADITSLCFRTGFSYQQLSNWHSEAELIIHLGHDYARFRQATSINSLNGLNKNAALFTDRYDEAPLKTIIDESLYQKTKIILNSIKT